MARLILVRHGETEWNRLLKYQGQKDIELNKRGLWQAKQTAMRLAPERVDAIYSSDLKRAVKTAEIIAASLGMTGDIQRTPLLREMNFGDFEGLTFEEIDKHYQKIILDSMSWKHRSPDMRAPNGESLSDVAARVDRFIEHLNPHNLDKTVLIVAHGGSLQLLICRM
ncbi:MAG: histidine phosphatase family protein, partial [Dehalococcoidia bacterium]